MRTKPTVHYTAGYVELHMLPNGKGMYARIYALDHPHLGEGDIRTSRIVNIDPHTGAVETMNTIYIPTPA